GSGGGVGCVVVVPAVEMQRSEVGGGVVLEMVTERRDSVAAWVVVLAVGRRTLPEKWRRVTKIVIVDRIDRVTGSTFGFAGKSPPEKSPAAAAAAGRRWWQPAAASGGGERVLVCVCILFKKMK
nr:hypothetical protein [Tanacetum cinerariifolium]